MTHYDTEQWAAEVIEGRRIFNAGFRMLPDDLPDWEFVKSVPIETSREDSELVHMWQRGDGRELLRIQVAELADWNQALERLREDLQMSMRSDIPRATGALGKLGDIAFGARTPETDVPAAVTFVRGNIFVSVRSVGDRAADASPVAVWLDEALSIPPRRGAPKGKQGTRRSIEAKPRKAGQEQIIVESVADATAEGWLKVLAADGELRRRGDSLIYVSGSAKPTRVELFTRRSGPARGKSRSG